MIALFERIGDRVLLSVKVKRNRFLASHKKEFGCETGVENKAAKFNQVTHALE